jgi:hypothetical protein
MDTNTFNDIVNTQIERSTSLLIKKADEYATEDRLHNFKVAAALQGITPAQALRGMLAKHTVSVFDMINSGKFYPEEVWDEKLTDSINYHLLLRALVEEPGGTHEGPIFDVNTANLPRPLEPWEIALLNATSESTMSLKVQTVLLETISEQIPINDAVARIIAAVKGE